MTTWIPRHNRQTIDVYVVLERRGDGYHTYDPDLLAVYFEEELARQHARQKPEYAYEAVPLAPQALKGAQEWENEKER